MPVNASETENFTPPTHRQILTILSGLLLGMFLGSLDQTIVSTSIRTIADDLHGLSIQAWVTTAYLITSTITTPIYGKLGVSGPSARAAAVAAPEKPLATHVRVAGA